MSMLSIFILFFKESYQTFINIVNISTIFLNYIVIYVNYKNRLSVDIIILNKFSIYNYYITSMLFLLPECY